MQQHTHTIRLIESRPLAGQVRLLAFRVPFRHRAGQYVALRADIGGRETWRYFSIASPPSDDGRIEMCIRLTGAFGERLGNLATGDGIGCSDPSGNLRPLDPARPSAYFAAGTGVAPLRAILLGQLARHPTAQAVLVLSARRPDELLFRRHFEELERVHPGFRFLPTVTGGGQDWTGRTGRAGIHVTEALAGLQSPVAYICGQPAMVTDLRGRLAKAGVPDERQSFERY